MINNKPRGKLILGFTGLMACGKGAAAKYLETKYQASTYRFSTMLRDMLTRIHLEHSRNNLVKMSECVRGTFGEGTMARTIAKDVEQDKNKIIIIEGIRRLADIEYLSKLSNFVLVEIFADAAVRHARMNRRGENPDDTGKTFAQFMEDHKRSTEMTIPEVASHATERIDNNGNLQDLYRQLDALVKKYKK